MMHYIISNCSDNMKLELELLIKGLLQAICLHDVWIALEFCYIILVLIIHMVILIPL